MNEKTAIQVLARSKQITADLDDMVRLVMESHLGEEEFNSFRRAVGRVMGELHDEVLTPLYERFPHLKSLG